MQTKARINVTKLAKDLNNARTTLHNLHKNKEKVISKFEAKHNTERKSSSMGLMMGISLF